MLVLATVICVILLIYGFIGQMKIEKEMEDEIENLRKRNRELEKVVTDMFMENMRIGIEKGL